jgi:hypothetical protein
VVKVGIDFDNTLVSYDDVFLRAAIEREFLPQHFTGNKIAVRDSIRLAAGDAQWAKLQAEVYGRRMPEAMMIGGAGEFVLACRKRGAEVFIVSHKSRYAAADPDGANLHVAALSWMEQNRFFSKDGLAFARGDIFFEPTREAKCRRIAELGCSHFIDDLEEVFREPAFPLAVERLLLHRGQGPLPRGPFTALADWTAISNVLFARDE